MNERSSLLKHSRNQQQQQQKQQQTNNSGNGEGQQAPPPPPPPPPVDLLSDDGNSNDSGHDHIHVANDDPITIPPPPSQNRRSQQHAPNQNTVQLNNELIDLHLDVARSVDSSLTVQKLQARNHVRNMARSPFSSGGANTNNNITSNDDFILDDDRPSFLSNDRPLRSFDLEDDNADIYDDENDFSSRDILLKHEKGRENTTEKSIWNQQSNPEAQSISKLFGVGDNDYNKNDEIATIPKLLSSDTSASTTGLPTQLISNNNIMDIISTTATTTNQKDSGDLISFDNSTGSTDLMSKTTTNRNFNIALPTGNSTMETRISTTTTTSNNVESNRRTHAYESLESLQRQSRFPENNIADPSRAISTLFGPSIAPSTETTSTFSNATDLTNLYSSPLLSPNNNHYNQDNMALRNNPTSNDSRSMPTNNNTLQQESIVMNTPQSPPSSPSTSPYRLYGDRTHVSKKENTFKQNNINEGIMSSDSNPIQSFFHPQPPPVAQTKQEYPHLEMNKATKSILKSTPSPATNLNSYDMMNTMNGSNTKNNLSNRSYTASRWFGGSRSSTTLPQQQRQQQRHEHPSMNLLDSAEMGLQQRSSLFHSNAPSATVKNNMNSNMESSVPSNNNQFKDVWRDAKDYYGKSSSNNNMKKRSMYDSGASSKSQYCNMLNFALSLSFGLTTIASSVPIALIPTIASEIVSIEQIDNDGYEVDDDGDSEYLEALASTFASKIAMYAVLGTSLGKLLNGPIGDVFGARRIACVYAILLSFSLFMLSFGCHSWSIMIPSICVEFFQSVQWPCIAVMLVAHYGSENGNDTDKLRGSPTNLPDNDTLQNRNTSTARRNGPGGRYEAGIYIASLASRVGSLLAGLTATALLRYEGWNWRQVARFASFLSFSGALVLYFFTTDSPERLHHPQNPVKDMENLIYKDTSTLTLPQKIFHWSRIAATIFMRNIVPSLRSVLSSGIFWIVAIAHSGGVIIITSVRILGTYFRDVSDGAISESQAGLVTLFLSVGVLLGLGFGGNVFTNLTNTGKARKTMVSRLYILTVGMCYTLSFLAIPGVRSAINSPSAVIFLQAAATFFMGAGVAVQVYCIPALVGTIFGANKGVFFSYIDGVACAVSSMVWSIVRHAVEEGNPTGAGWAYGWAAVALLVIFAGLLMVVFVEHYCSRGSWRKLEDAQDIIRPLSRSYSEYSSSIASPRRWLDKGGNIFRGRKQNSLRGVDIQKVLSYLSTDDEQDDDTSTIIFEDTNSMTSNHIIIDKANDVKIKDAENERGVRTTDNKSSLNPLEENKMTKIGLNGASSPSSNLRLVRGVEESQNKGTNFDRSNIELVRNKSLLSSSSVTTASVSTTTRNEQIVDDNRNVFDQEPPVDQSTKDEYLSFFHKGDSASEASEKDIGENDGGYRSDSSDDDTWNITNSRSSNKRGQIYSDVVDL